MSLILDAINRSQRERANPGEVPGVATVHYAEATVAPSAWRQGLIGLALILVLVGVAWFLLRPAPDVPPQAVQPQAVQPPQPQPEPQAPVPPAPAQTVSTPPTVDTPAPATAPEPSAEVSALYAGAGDGEDEARDEVVEATAQAAATAPIGSTVVTPRPAVKNAPPAAVSEEPLDVEELVARARAEMRNASLQEHPAPFLSELSQQRKDAIPTLLYSQHDYRGDGGRSTVMINGKSVAAGQPVGKGVKVDEILPDSVVLSFGGEQFRLKALNSWVNL
ncbi:hypothetical protein FV139_18320 [Parahaliea maris]|uniref:Type II secretion system protein GspB C-terminal domain-containing protein n=1 Tax=Parahaliea maris TaxID=2716870 RepID=A0A5C8ZR61_9GAMM|nr:general secretion pathway protein GspB [Parahaliea maris]TXS90219.1 hypothetical protein FV139_18320 [Parahaliea maris]